MSNPIRQTRLDLELANRTLRGPAPRAARRQIDAVAYDCITTGVRVDGAGYVTHVALSHLGSLSRLESQLISSFPLEDMGGRIKAEARARLLVDGFTAVAAAEIQRLAW